MKTTVYRYNAERREDRSFNTTEREKNPNAVKYFARTLEYAEKYKTIYDEDGFELYDCELETSEVNMSELFDMTSNFESLKTFAQWLDNEVRVAKTGYEVLLSRATTKRDQELWTRELSKIDEYRSSRIRQLKLNEFQYLSDFDYQNALIAELTAMGYKGYFTEREIAIF